MIEVTASKKHMLGMPVAEFLRDYWQKKPLLIRQAFADFKAPLQPEDLAGLACEQGVLARVVKYNSKNDHYSLHTGPFKESFFPKLPKKDWTLLVQDMDKWDADVGELLKQFNFLPRWRVDDIMISFAAPGGSVGAHVDQYDVFLLQAQGQRRWEIDTNSDCDRSFRENTELKLLQNFVPDIAWTLEPGDMLYLPPGVPHHGVAVDACMTFSVGMRAPSHAELVSDWADGLLMLLSEEERYTDQDLSAPRDAAEIDDATAQRVLDIFEQYRPHSKDEAAAFFARFITRYRNAQEIAAPPRAPTPAQTLAKLEKGAQLQSHPFARWAWRKDGKHGVLFVNGEAFETSVNVAARIAQNTQISAIEFSQFPVQERALVFALIERGYLLVGAT